MVQRYLSRVGRVVAVDTHTGLGAFGAAEVILGVPKDSPDYRRALAIWGPTLVRTTVTGDSVSAHIEASLDLAIAEMLPGTEVTAVTLEFGTIPPLKVFKALRDENWLHHHGGMKHSNARALKTCLLRAFHPESGEWKASVWSKGRQIVEQALESLRP